MNTEELFSLEEFTFKGIFDNFKYPWEALVNISNFVLNFNTEGYKEVKKDVWVGEGTIIDEGALVLGPTIIGKNCQIRFGAYIRGNVIIGNDVVVGNSTEVKNSIIFNSVQIPHYNYVGDSILGNFTHLGAGVKLSNVRSDKREIIIKKDIHMIRTSMKKLGAIIGDNCEIGCNSVLNPGTVLGKNTTVFPLVSVTGYVPDNCIVKGNKSVVRKV